VNYTNSLSLVLNHIGVNICVWILSEERKNCECFLLTWDDMWWYLMMWLMFYLIIYELFGILHVLFVKLHITVVSISYSLGMIRSGLWWSYDFYFISLYTSCLAFYMFCWNYVYVVCMLYCGVNVTVMIYEPVKKRLDV
jgi:hypothetical protein